ncbi:M28 family peptidase [Wukongibacter baidiensis]|uniref:M28 family peptidase n=1 Tax=Wukongibacter baidiensis TaxID=1723361 RepID=UPI003D7F3AFD
MGGSSDSKKLKPIYLVLPILIFVLIIFYCINSYTNSFDETIFNADNAYDHINELATSKYNGRLTGTEGNSLALKYVEDHFEKLGIEPAGENGTYYQYFDCLVPQIDTQPVFTIEDTKGNILEELKIYEDYRAFTYSVGGGIRFEGDILLVDKYLSKTDPEIIKDKIVVMASTGIREKDVQYVLENGGRGLLFNRLGTFQSVAGNDYRIKSVSSDAKKGKGMFFGALGRDAYFKLKKLSDPRLLEEEYERLGDSGTKKPPKGAGIIRGVKLKCDLEFPVVKSANIIGKIDGKKKDGGYLIIGAHIDHAGSGTDEKYFPGALDNASGVGMILELARVIKNQNNLPYRTIVFALWNGEENGLVGSKYYVENPIYPLEKSQVINLDCIGTVNASKVNIEYNETVGKIIGSKMYQYADDLEIDTEAMHVSPNSDHYWFAKAKVPTIQLEDGYSSIHTYDDKIDNIGKEKLESVGVILTNYIKRDVFRDTSVDYLNNVELVILVLFIIGTIFIYIIVSLNKVNPHRKVFNTKAEDIYYSSLFNVLLKCYYFITPALIIIFSLLFTANLPQNFNIVFHNGEAYSNLSMYLSLKKSVLYIRNLMLNGLGTTENHVEIFEIVFKSMGRSMKLIGITIIISLCFGVLKGMFDSYRGGRKGEFRTLATLMTFSLPDVFIVLCGMLLISYISKNDVLKQLVDLKSLRGFIIPLLTLSIIPMVYISRITFIVVQEEIKKGYVVAARCKGLSRLQVFTKHIVVAVVLKIVDSIPTLITIIISNLIVVEYLFNYKGIVFNLYRFYEEHDVTSFIGFSLVLGLIYILFVVLSKLIAKVINPFKNRTN